MERTLLYKHGRQAFAYQEFQERLGSAAKKLLPVVMGFVVMATTLGYTNNAWAQKGVNDITLAPGKTVALNFKVYCIKYGMPLTSEPVEFRGRSQQGVVHILHYARSKGYVDSNPVQVQLAIWRQTTGEWKAADHAIAEEIFKNAKKAPTESKAGAVFLTDAVKAGTVQVTATQMDPVKVANSPVDWPWLGAGRLTLTNKGKQNVTVVVRDGFDLSAPHEHMIGYVIGLAK